MARIRTRDGRILHVTSMQTLGNHPTSYHKTRQAQQKTLTALIKASQHLTQYTKLLYRADKNSDMSRNTETFRREEALRLGSLWNSEKLTMEEYRKALKELKMVAAEKQKDDDGKASSGREKKRFWKEIRVGAEDVVNEINRLKGKGILGNADGEEEIAPTTVDESRQPMPEFCTPECLMGLQQGGKLDLDCPNVVRHRRGVKGKHQVSRTKFPELVKEQLWQEMDGSVNLRCLAQGGNLPGQKPKKSWMGVFTLQQYGYTLLVKGYTYWWKRRACHELEMYNRVDDKQDRVVPLCFGLFELPTPCAVQTVLNGENWQVGDSAGYILLLSYGTVATPATSYPPVGFNETLANGRLQTALMGQYGIGFQNINTGVSALWKNGRLVSINLDDCDIVRWRGQKSRLPRKRQSSRVRHEYFLERRWVFKLRQVMNRKRKDAGLPRWYVLEEC